MNDEKKMLKVTRGSLTITGTAQDIRALSGMIMIGVPAVDLVAMLRHEDAEMVLKILGVMSQMKTGSDLIQMMDSGLKVLGNLDISLTAGLVDRTDVQQAASLKKALRFLGGLQADFTAAELASDGHTLQPGCPICKQADCVDACMKTQEASDKLNEPVLEHTGEDDCPACRAEAEQALMLAFRPQRKQEGEADA